MGERTVMGMEVNDLKFETNCSCGKHPSSIVHPWKALESGDEYPGFWTQTCGLQRMHGTKVGRNFGGWRGKLQVWWRFPFAQDQVWGIDDKADYIPRHILLKIWTWLYAFGYIICKYSLIISKCIYFYGDVRNYILLHIRLALCLKIYAFAYIILYSATAILNCI